MRTVQIAVRDSVYARCLRDLLSRDGTCNALVVEEPDLNLDGVVLIERGAMDTLPAPLVRPDRFVVIAPKDVAGLTSIFNAGVHHVVFEGDSPNTVQLAVIAAMLRSTRLKPASRRESQEFPGTPQYGSLRATGSSRALRIS